MAAAALCSQAVSLAGIFLLVRSEENVLAYAALSVLAAYGSSIFCFFMLPRVVDFSFRIHINPKHFRPLLVFFMMSCAVSIYSNLDLVMLGFMKPDFETGLYSVAAKGKAALTLLSGVVWSTIMPHATVLWKNGARRQFESLARKTIVFVFGIQLLITVFCFLLARPIILLLGGGAYLGSVPVFRILLLSLVPIGLSNILGGQVLIPAGKEKRLLSAELVGAAVNFTANLFVIPRFSIEGAAATTVLAEVVVWLICLYYAGKDLQMDFGAGLFLLVLRRGKREGQKLLAVAENRFWGDRLPYYCPCCDTRLRGLVNGGYDKIPDSYNPERYASMDQEVICPVCGSLPRHRILVSWMQERRDLFMGKEILHFAQERCVRRWMDRNHLSAVTADLYQPADLNRGYRPAGRRLRCDYLQSCSGACF